MTGSTAVLRRTSNLTSTAAAAEQREPAVVGYRNHSAAMHDDDDEEPYDAVRSRSHESSGNSNSVKRMMVEHDELEDGELPSLSSTRSKSPGSGSLRNSINSPTPPSTLSLGGRMVGGQRTTTRPLSPPSRAGLVAVPAASQDQRVGAAFWNQLDVSGDNMMQPVVVSPRNSRFGSPSSRSTERPFDEGGVVDRSRSGNETLDLNTSGEYDGLGFCATTLQAIGEMCGDYQLNKPVPPAPYLSSTVEPQSPPPPRRLLSRGSSKDAVPDEEEHTAIEVEFVEPADRELSAEKKNAYLNAMTKRAKQGFERTRSNNSSRANSKDEGDVDDAALVGQGKKKLEESAVSAGDDVYKNMSGADKRKFLKLINGGMSPAEAYQQISSRVSSSTTDKKERGRGLGLAFWKKNKNEATTTPASPKPVDTTDTTDRQSDESEAAAPAGPIDDMVVSSSGTALEDKVARAVRSLSPQSRRGKARNENGMLVKSPVAGSPRSAAVTKSSSNSSSMMIPLQPSAEFSRSGINYYDAVRRDQSIDDETDDMIAAAMAAASGPNNKKSSSSARLKLRSITPKGLRAKGFSSLGAEGEDDNSNSANHTQQRTTTAGSLGSTEAAAQRAKSAPRVRTMPSTQSSRPVSAPRGVMSVPEHESLDLVGPASDGARASSRTVKTLLAEAQAHREHLARQEVDRVERDLLRPGSMVEPVNRRSRAEAVNIQPERKPTRQQSRFVPALTVSSQSAARLIKPVTTQDLDVDIENYLQSTDAYSGGGANAFGFNHPASDAMSVFTATTSASNYTQSSRIRRPGAAKERLAKAKKAEQKKGGWHETILAAAESTHREWVPDKGWLDYKEGTGGDVFDATGQAAEKMHLDLNKSFRSNKSGNTSREEAEWGGDPITIPFPQEWTKDRDDMMPKSPEGDEQHVLPSSDQVNNSISFAESRASKGESVTSANVSRAESQVSRVSSRANRSPGTDEAPDSRPKGWLETMKIASAALAKDGYVWDPVKGWLNSKDGTPPMVSDAVNFDESPHQETLQQSPRSPQNSPVAVTPPGTPATKRSPQSQSMSPHAYLDSLQQPQLESGYISDATDENSYREPKLMAMPLPTGQLEAKEEKLNRFMSGKEHQRRSEASVEDSEHAVASIESGRYRQLATGPKEPNKLLELSTQTDAVDDDYDVQQDYDIADNEKLPENIALSQVDDDDYDETPLLEHSSIDFSTGDTPYAKRIDIEREKVGADELELFGFSASDNKWPDPHQSPKHGLLNSDKASLASSKVLSVRHVAAQPRSSVGSPRRGAGPVDIDEVDGLSSGEDSNNGPSSPPRQAEPATEDFALRPELGRSFDSKGSTKKVPKLRRSRRDTSPIRSSAGAPDVCIDDQPARRVWGASARRDVTNEFMPDIKEPEGDKYMQRGITGYIGQGTVSPIQTSPAGTRTVDTDSIFNFSPQHDARRDVAERENPDSVTVEDESKAESVVYGSEAYGPSPTEQKSFFKRLAECAAPIMPQAAGGEPHGVPSEHLAFMQKHKPHPSAQKQSLVKYVPPALCGRPDSIREDVDDATYEDENTTDDGDDTTKSELRAPSAVERHRAASAPRIRPHGSGSSSVASDDFGAKTAYLEAIAMRTAVSKPKKRRNGKSSESSVGSTASSQHSEKWRAFLERKKAAGTSPAKSRASAATDVSRAASEVINNLSGQSRAKSAPRAGYNYMERSRQDTYEDEDEQDYTANSRYDDSTGSRRARKAEAARAAEDLAAARVEAMMAALSTSHIDEVEI